MVRMRRPARSRLVAPGWRCAAGGKNSYNAARGMGVEFCRGPVQQLGSDIRTDLENRGLYEHRAPQSYGNIGRFENPLTYRSPGEAFDLSRRVRPPPKIYLLDHAVGWRGPAVLGVLPLAL